MGSLGFFGHVILFQLFWSVAITGYSLVIPAEELQFVTLFTEDSTATTLQTTAPIVERSVQNQVSLPLIDAATLIFYSGNLIMSLILNFLTAIPQMAILGLNALFLFVPINPQLQTIFKLFILVGGTILYIISFISAITTLRSGGAQIG